ncbi:39S ribosomal protein L52, mitochondrial [Sitophilus oryzae]|uniref:Large ribosomal subunit protein mL52 n=1 Tax=Sitophilus oryzae TaxID=7048 RepID=A0A6J2XFU1_SITOR|nr:39S ribosomal protein L52, mitochondrial [Sitophilus oryzae]
MLQIRNNALLLCRLCVQKRSFSFTSQNNLNQKYRKEKNLPLNPNASGILTDGPDFSYLDGRLTPLTQGQKRRVLGQEKVKRQIISLSKEIDFAVEYHKQLQDKEAKEKAQILERKLKPKGVELLKSE